MTVTLVTAATVTVASGLASLSMPWAEISGTNALYIVASAVFILGGYFFSVQVMRTGEVSFTAPFRYSGLVWALILGWFLFSEWPSLLTMIGAVIVVGTGIFTFYRERKLSAGG